MIDVLISSSCLQYELAVLSTYKFVGTFLLSDNFLFPWHSLLHHKR